MYINPASIDQKLLKEYHNLINETICYDFSNLLFDFYKSKNTSLEEDDLFFEWDEEEYNEEDLINGFEEDFDDNDLWWELVFKGKKDLLKINLLKDFIIKDISKPQILYNLIKIVKNKDINRKKLIPLIPEPSVQDAFYIVFKDYQIIYNKVINEIILKFDLHKKNKEKNINILKTDFLNWLLEIEVLIQKQNDNKEEIIKNVYKAKAWDKEWLEFISEIMLEEASNIAKKYSYKNWTFDEQLYDDLKQQALVSWFSWIKRYLTEKSDNFILYIRHWLYLWIFSYLNIHYNQIKIPAHTKQMIRRIQKVAEELNIEVEMQYLDVICDVIFKEEQEKLRDRKKELQNKIDFSENKNLIEECKDKLSLVNEKLSYSDRIKLRSRVKDAIEKKWFAEVFSMDTLVNKYEDSDGNSYEEILLEDKETNIVSSVLKKEDEEKLEKFMRVVLTDEEFLVVAHREGLFWEDKLLLETLWKKINKSAERVRQILNKALQKLSIKSFDEYSQDLVYSKSEEKFYII